MKEKIKRHRKEISYFIKNAPLAIITSSLPGFVNYASILLLTAYQTMETVGQFRLYMSYYALIGLVSFQESSKVQVRALACGDLKANATLFFMRLYGIVLATLGIIGLWHFQKYFDTTLVPDGLIPIAVLSCIGYPTDLFISYLQAEKRFAALAIASAVKFIGALGAFALMVFTGHSIFAASMVQIGLIVAFNVAFFAIWLGRSFMDYARETWSPLALLRSTQVHDSFTLSLANWLPSTLEHIDKMVIGYLFGLKILGLYTLAFSTGRFIYNALKPAFYIYYRHFVEALPGPRLLMLVMGSFTVFGMGLSAIFWLGMGYIPSFAKFSGAEPVVYIFFLSYGIAMVDAVYTQSYGINREAKAHHLLISTTLISIACLLLFSSCIFVEPSVAMIICAMHYPVRHAGTIMVLSSLKRRLAKKPAHL